MSLCGPLCSGARASAGLERFLAAVRDSRVGHLLREHDLRQQAVAFYARAAEFKAAKSEVNTRPLPLSWLAICCLSPLDSVLTCLHNCPLGAHRS